MHESHSVLGRHPFLTLDGLPSQSLFHTEGDTWLPSALLFVIDLDLFRIQERGGVTFSQTSQHLVSCLSFFINYGSPLYSRYDNCLPRCPLLSAPGVSLYGLYQQVPLFSGFPLDLACGQLPQVIGGKENDVREFIT